MTEDDRAVLDRVIADLQMLRDRLAGEPLKSEGAAPEPELDDDDFIDTATAAERFNIPIDTIRWLCRKKGMGRKQGNKWLASVTAFRRYRERS
ncbi:hypothetical protein GFM11_10230 [Rhizobium leguminosarum bv. viciae]|uniref:hypothetical protein n=1 Tax=Rhizobium leguminosarum TaxID=384 RepID=UPI0014426350|nr:hypothetical protein [Rhizobium leguminosarum]NKK13655.1 hypothetical protein [Rhizobium leguminosarum bv. viciae]